ncbi:MAG TPA: methyltransferase domain-containing protein [Edaphocola sp.]|nr:methyltransferase domain-containing protein [Edaphocola sp.]
MYQKLKSILRKNISGKWLQRNELWLRVVYARYFVPKGDCRCTVCGHSLKAFLPIEKGELLCPACGSGKRHRRLFLLLRREMASRNISSILDFSPNKGFHHYAGKLFGKAYQTTNFDPEDETDYHFDITRIGISDCSFDIILCYHVLEHIIEDVQAMGELFRVMTPGGSCYIQTPFKEGAIYEDEAIVTPKERLSHFEQEDHVRIYSVEGLAERLKSVGFLVEILYYQSFDNPEETKKYGFKDEEFILLAKKP